MGDSKRTIPFRRKREGRTDYKKRLALLKSGETRLVIRRTNTQLIVQFVDYNPEGDEVLLTVDGKDIKDLGWDNSKKNLPGAYLIGLKAGAEAVKKDIEQAILDMGMHTHSCGSRIYSALKGVIDAGVDVPCSEKVFPSSERISGEHISEGVKKDFEKVKKKISKD